MRGRPNLLVLSGSTRGGSHNGRLAALAARDLALHDVEVRLLSLADYPLPLYDGDLEAARGVPEAALKLADLVLVSQGVFIASPEYNQSVTPLLKNSIDWLSRLRGDRYRGLWTERVFAIGAASPGHFAGIRSLMHLRHILENALGARVLTQQVAVPYADKAFDEGGNLANDKAAAQLERLVTALIGEAGRFV
ncbi:putative flavoprotein [uncultured Pleomorphomonas sp.]|uniref:Putative flavoprotein n=1 Tax=uncultured Pleomorphomonas sp. TaxID=442121 RepID=A0A212LKB8_9HYPH|nr:NAD(P)H-dependent oxidoreductase [uncultured Pleomorphomonas sp.]SCM77829.1 putative flavoprotein [uncultured Pleomorphomonas sp.]